MKKIIDTTALFFIGAVGVLSVVSIFGVWDYFDRDVIIKSFETLGLLALVAVIVMVAGHFIEGKSKTEVEVVPDLPNPIFKHIRQITIVALIVSVTFLAILGVLAIWDVIGDKKVLYKTFTSVIILVFATIIMVMTSLEREGNRLLKREGKPFNVGAIILIVFLAYIFLGVIGSMFR